MTFARICAPVNGMTLPDTRNTTYAALSQVLSADINDIQDKIIDGSHGEQTLFIPACDFIAVPGSEPSYFVQAWSSLDTGASSVRLALRLPVGAVLTGAIFYFFTADTEQATVSIIEYDDITATIDTTTLESKTTPTSDDYDTVEFDSGDTNIPHTMAADQPVLFLVSLPQTSAPFELSLYGASITYRKP